MTQGVPSEPIFFDVFLWERGKLHGFNMLYFHSRPFDFAVFCYKEGKGRVCVKIKAIK